MEKRIAFINFAEWKMRIRILPTWDQSTKCSIYWSAGTEMDLKVWRLETSARLERLFMDDKLWKWDSRNGDQSGQESIVRALGWLDRCQITENPKYYHASHRHRTRGAWPFSTKKQSYTVSDCTSDALKSVLLLQKELA
ncbi:hypothetical protein H4Q26_014931 [Puccinia striiformis f. sp. tritici PST-130]|nr:hypothetical protein H4Q26_014931 [Puccinia striiformis f. sp. tritici PST-130]